VNGFLFLLRTYHHITFIIIVVTKNAIAPMGHILLVDDETHITDLLRYNLESEHFGVHVCQQAEQVKAMDLSDMRLIVADCMSQPFSGLHMLMWLKDNARTVHIPVIILSHSDSEDDIITAFNAGADDYVSKPFSLRELVARIRSVLRRHPNSIHSAHPTPAPLMLSFGSLTIDLINRQARIGDTMLALTKTEYAILALLAKNKGKFFTRHEIFDQVWSNIDRGSNDRIVDTNISRLRKKLQSGADLIQNKTGYGYTMIDV